MRTVRFVIGGAAAALLVSGLSASAAHHSDVSPFFGMVGLSRTQTAVLNVVLTGTPDDRRPACRRVLSFVDGQGRRFHDSAGNEVSRQVELRGNAAESLTLRSRDVLGDGQLRAPIRAVLTAPHDDGTASDCRGLVATLEIVSCQPRPQTCPGAYAPICGCDGVTYTNVCLAAKAGVTMAASGACPGTACQGNLDCATQEYCAKPIGDCGGAGTCQPRPSSCTNVYDPVCGCDAATYPNACLAAHAGVNVAAQGTCGR